MVDFIVMLMAELLWAVKHIVTHANSKRGVKMTLSEALKFAEECRKNGNISTSAKAVMALADEVKRLEEQRNDEIAEARYNDKD